MISVRTYRRRAAVAVLAVALACSAGACSKKNAGASGSASHGSGSGQITVAFVPKLEGIPYFSAMNTGGEEAAKALGFKWIYEGATTADPAAQASIVQSLIQQHVNVIAVAPNDPNSMAPVLAQAKAAGIKVITADTDDPSSVRQVFVNQATAEGIGQALTDQLAKAMGGSGEYAIVSCGQTAANLNSWIAVQKSYAAHKYPNLKLDDIVYASEDQAQAVTMSKSLIAAHPNLKGLVGECTSSAPGVAQAVQEANKIGKIVTVGVGTPKSMLPYLKNGASSASVLWNVENLGYLTGWTGYELAKGKQLQASNDVSASMTGIKYGTFDGVPTVLLGDPLIITAANAGQYDY